MTPSLATAFHSILFILTGVYGTIGGKFVIERGAGDVRAGLIQLATFLGFALSSYFASARAADERRNVVKSQSTNELKWYGLVAMLAMLEIAGSILCAIGFQSSDASTFQVLCSSGLVFTAILSVTLMKNRLSMMQYAGVTCVTLGLALSSFEPATSVHPKQPSDGAASGAICTIIGCFLYALACVGTEYACSRSRGLITSARYLRIASTLQTCVTAAYIFFFVRGPRADELLWQPISQSKSSVIEIAAFLVLIVLNNIVRGLNYTHIMAQAGSVVIGLLNALVTIGVFIASAVLFCTPNEPA